jgi:tetratricopeptide (TPR) repeat protein
VRVEAACSLFCLALALSLGLPAAAQTGSKPAADAAAAKPAEARQEEPEERERRWGRRDEGQDEKGWVRTYSIDERTAKRLIEAREHLMAERYDEAETALGRLRLRSLNPLERAQTFRIHAFIAYGRNDFDRARDFLEKTIAEEVLSSEDGADVRFMIAQLFLHQERWAEAAQNLERWFTMVESPNPGAYYLLALTYYQLEDLHSAVAPAQQAVELAKAPQEGWLQLLLALRLTRKEYPAALPLLEELIRRYPKKIYWIQLSTLHGALGNYEEALVPLQMAYTQGLLTEQAELRRLAELLLFLDLPYRAARVMERGLEEERIDAEAEAYELLSNSWIAAREYEKAVEPLERAAELSEGGDLYVRLAQVHVQREKWSEAAAALRQALEKGGLANTGDAQLLMGIAYYSQKRPQQALRWFARARKHEETRDEAQIWLDHIRRELQSG